MLVSVLAFLFILAFSITIHELGHFFVAKLFHIPVEKFSIGYGPPLFRKMIGETDFRIAYFPLGGYVKMAGEEEGEVLSTKDKLKADEESGLPGFYDAPIYSRILVVISGPLFNIISAVVVFFIIFMGFGIFVNPYMKIEVEKDGPAEVAGLLTNDSIVAINGQGVRNWDEFSKIVAKSTNKDIAVTVMRNNTHIDVLLPYDSVSLGLQPLVPPILGSLKLDGPAYKAGMKTGDRVIKIDDQAIRSWDHMVEIVRRSRDRNLSFAWLHNDEIKMAQISPASFYDPIDKDTIGQIGVMMPLKRYKLSPVSAISFALNRSGEILWLTVKTLAQLIIGQVSRKSIGGPIAIARLSAESVRWGFENLLGLLAIISINLGLINLFPIPALDGGHVLISIIEGVRRKRFSRKTRILIQQIGYAIIFLLILLVTFNDITR